MLTSILVILFVIYWKPNYPLFALMSRYYPTILTSPKYDKSFSLSNNNEICLTFDDAPYKGVESLNQIVELLDKEKMKGTFFVISGQVDDDSRKVLVQMVKNGHQLGNHGIRDVRHYSLPIDDLTREIKECDKLIREIYDEAGVDLPTIMLYRPGCGLFHKEMIKLATDLGYTLTLGTVYPEDPHIRSSYVNYLYLKYHVDENDIVILHDRKWTPKTLELFLDVMKSKKLNSVTIETLLTKKTDNSINVSGSSLREQAIADATGSSSCGGTSACFPLGKPTGK